MAKSWKVVNGITAWKDKVGRLISIEDGFITLRIKEIEFEKEIYYHVRMPLGCCKEIEEE